MRKKKHPPIQTTYPSNPHLHLLHEVKTKYNHIKVIDDFPIRKMFFGREGMCREQAAIDLNNEHTHVHDYSLLIMHSVIFVQDPKDILVVGCGGGIVPSQFNYYFPDANIDVVEIDPEVVNTAKRFFYFKDSGKIQVYIGDAYTVLSEMKKKKYDIIILDAFTHRYVPFHLMSKEFFHYVLNLSRDNSVIVSNASHAHPSFNSHINTIRSVLGEDTYHLSGFRNSLTDIIYSVRGDVIPIKSSNLNCHFIFVQPEKMVITEEIKSAKIFSILSP